MAIGNLLGVLIAASNDNATPNTLEKLMEAFSSISIGEKIVAIIGMLGVLATLSTHIDILTGNIGKLIGNTRKHFCKQKITDKEIQDCRQDLIERVLSEVVKRLDDSLHYKIRIDLRRQEELQRVGRLNKSESMNNISQFPIIGRLFESFNTDRKPVSIEDSLSTVALLNREDIKGRLLILGERGAGKTNELLSTTKELLQKAKESPVK